MKRIAYLLFVLLLLVACGGGAPEESASPPDTSETTSPEEQAAPTAEESSTTGEAPTTEMIEGGGETVVEEPVEEGIPAVDPETGLAINPSLDVAQSGEEFIVIGVANSANLTPQTSPEYLIISATDGKTRYRVMGQSLAETFYEDGSAVPLVAFQQKPMLRATVKYDPNAQVGGRFISTNVTVLKPEE